MAVDDLSYGSIEPSHFDLAIVGTGLPESILAAASSAIGKSVLHLDPNSFYGGSFSSLSLDEFTSFLNSQQDSPTTTDTDTDTYTTTDYVAVDLKPPSLYSGIEISNHGSPQDLEQSRKFSLDLSGPRVLFCADSIVNLMLKSGASNHVEFKSIDASFIYNADGKLSTVPDSRAAIFKDKSLGLLEKNQMMRFFKLVQQHFGIDSTTEEKQTVISDEDLDSPFIDFLDKQRLPPKIKSIILYAIAMADYDQERPELRENLVKTKDGIEMLGLYHSSVGRFANAVGALIYPIYGQGELPQAFCRCAAVKGALYVLRMPVKSLLLDKENKFYKGLRLASGQEIFSNQLIMASSIINPLPPVLSPPPHVLHERSERFVAQDVKGKVARAVCILKGSVLPGLSNLLIIAPPRSLYPEQTTSVRVLQLGSNLAVCPPGMCILYLSTMCDNDDKGKESLHTAIEALLTCSISESHERTASILKETVEETAPILLWKAMYIQQLTKVSAETVSLCPMPDGNLDYKDILQSTEQLFHDIYPNEEFMLQTNATEDIADEVESD